MTSLSPDPTGCRATAMIVPFSYSSDGLWPNAEATAACTRTTKIRKRLGTENVSVFENTGGFASATTYAGGHAKTTVKSCRCLGLASDTNLTRQTPLPTLLPEK